MFSMQLILVLISSRYLTMRKLLNRWEIYELLVGFKQNPYPDDDDLRQYEKEFDKDFDLVELWFLEHKRKVMSKVGQTFKQ